MISVEGVLPVVSSAAIREPVAEFAVSHVMLVAPVESPLALKAVGAGEVRLGRRRPMHHRGRQTAAENKLGRQTRPSPPATG